MGAFPGVSGRRDAKEVEADGTKTRAERNEKDSPTHPNHRALSHPLLNKVGSSICDQFPELLLESFAMSGLNNWLCLNFNFSIIFIT